MARTIYRTLLDAKNNSFDARMFVTYCQGYMQGTGNIADHAREALEEKLEKALEMMCKVECDIERALDKLGGKE